GQQGGKPDTQSGGESFLHTSSPRNPWVDPTNVGGPLPQVGHVYANTGGPLVVRVWATFIGWGIHTRTADGTVVGRTRVTGRVARTMRTGASVSQCANVTRLCSP